MSRIILASKSPRRFELLSMTGLSFEVITSHVDEDAVEASVLAKYRNEAIRADMYQIAEDVACAQALAKAEAVLDSVGADGSVSGGSGAGCKGSEGGAGCKSSDGNSEVQSRCFSAFADVKFHDLDELQAKEIERYIAGGSPMDKAGAYGIQDEGSLLIDSIAGDYYAVVGLPIARVNRELRDLL